MHIWLCNLCTLLCFTATSCLSCLNNRFEDPSEILFFPKQDFSNNTVCVVSAFVDIRSGRLARVELFGYEATLGSFLDLGHETILVSYFRFGAKLALVIHGA
ncbi:hypothetical protein Y032_0124g1184 [Ancylostoma ceylanicum]|uniref:Secreted protein n=1 Tax=Ancylostoma ceylanicum TaxID=53326 RepID=A0A016T8W6_9BILA|nr:hypothetical protein Y032_0124g1184 [Ancylostoma ceylanicum]